MVLNKEGRMNGSSRMGVDPMGLLGPKPIFTFPDRSRIGMGRHNGYRSNVTNCDSHKDGE